MYFLKLTLLITILNIASLVIGVFIISPETLTKIATEHGVIENITALLFFLTFILSTYILWKKKTSIWIAFTILSFMAFFRELDLHKAFTQDSILKLKFYTKSDAPLYEKIGGIVFILVLASGACLLFAHFKSLRLLFEEKHYALKTFIFSILLIVIAKFFDSMGRIHDSLLTLKTNYDLQFLMLEEQLEMMASALFLYACYLAFRNLKAEISESLKTGEHQAI